MFERFLDSAPKSGSYDAVREAVVLLVGSLARHLEPDDVRLRPIALRLVAALSTPAQQVPHPHITSLSVAASSGCRPSVQPMCHGSA